MSFNSSSTLLAASSDALRLVVVWAVAGPALGQRVASFSLHNRAVLPLRFLPPHHPLTALQQGVAAAAAAARGAATDADAAGEGTAAGVLQLQAGPGALTRAAVGAAGVLGVGSTGQLQDRLLAYCELYGGLHLADLRWVQGVRWSFCGHSSGVLVSDNVVQRMLGRGAACRLCGPAAA